MAWIFLAGLAGFTLALEPWVRPVAYCEIDRHCQSVLLSRQAEGRLPWAPVWDDVRTLTAAFLPSKIEIVYGGFPCTDLSDASRGRGKGLEGRRVWASGLKCSGSSKRFGPGTVFIENVSGSATKKWLPFVRRDLHKAGYTSMPLCVRAAAVGAPFRGDRVFLAASHRQGQSAFTINAEVAVMREPTDSSWCDWGKPPAGALGVANGLPAELERLKALGNAIVPAQAREAFRRLMAPR
jgi:DNA (cytosine-5)-methyltransferase 1